MASRLLVVDDSKTDMALICSFLSDYDPIRAWDGREAMTLLETRPDVDLMILDLNMPVMNGFEVLEALRPMPESSKPAVLILTNHDETENEIRGLDLGAVDYIRKPLNFSSLRKRIEVHLSLRRARRRIEQSNEVLEQTVRQRTHEIEETRAVTIHALLGLLEVRNIESSNHAQRTQWIIRALAEKLREHPDYQPILTDAYIQDLFDTAPLHDIGKVGIPDHILLKPGPLAYEEYEVMKQHVRHGVDALTRSLGDREPAAFLRIAIDLVASHHEWFDGSGYPAGLSGVEIPLCGRLMAVVDVYDAMTGKRVYKPAMSHEEVIRLMQRSRGHQFDPIIIDAFLSIEQQVREIAHRFYTLPDPSGEETS